MTLVYGKWIDHDGTCCPVPAGFVVDLIAISSIHGEVRFTGLARGGRSWFWENYPKVTKIVRYRIHKPKSAKLIDKILCELPLGISNGVPA